MKCNCQKCLTTAVNSSGWIPGKKILALYRFSGKRQHKHSEIILKDLFPAKSEYLSS